MNTHGLTFTPRPGRSFRTGFAIAVLAAWIAPASASMTVRFADSWGRTAGGEFTATLSGFGGPVNFQTFCLERNEHIIFGRVNGVDPFRVDSISDFADGGGIGGGPHDPLDLRTKWLYERFATGQLQGYDYATNRARSADALQTAIWFLENELPANTNGDGMTGDSQADAFIQMAEAAVAAGYVDSGAVKVLNISWGVNYGNFRIGDGAQSQLILVPAPGAVVLGVVGCIVLALVRRRVAA